MRTAGLDLGGESVRANPDVAPIPIHPAILISHFSL